MVIDAAIIAQRCDGLVVTASGSQSRKAVQKAKEQLSRRGQFIPRSGPQ